MLSFAKHCTQNEGSLLHLPSGFHRRSRARQAKCKRNRLDQVTVTALSKSSIWVWIPRGDPRWQRGSNPSPLNPELHRPGCCGRGPSSASMTTRTLSAITSLAEYNLSNLVCRDVHIERRQDTFSSSLAKCVLLVRWRTHCRCQGGRSGSYRSDLLWLWNTVFLRR